MFKGFTYNTLYASQISKGIEISLNIFKNYSSIT